MKKIKRKLFKLVNWVDRDALELLNDSAYFDHDWYKSNLKELKLCSRKELVRHYLLHDSLGLRNPSDKFDAKWYLEHYNDVKISEINPLLHFLKYGQHEGRLPMNNRAAAWESYLWLGSSLMERKLLSATKNPVSFVEKSYSLWALGRWYYFKGKFSESSTYLREFALLEKAYPIGVEPYLLLIHNLIETSVFEDAASFLNLARSKYGNLTDLILLESDLNLAVAHTKGMLLNKARLKGLNTIYRSSGLIPLDIKYNRQEFDLNNLFVCKPDNSLQVDGVMVSIIIPMFNAEKRIESVLRSLVAQTWKNIEVVVVDDCSTDLSTTIVKEFIKNTTIRIRLVELDVNSGPYVARNKGLNFVEGQYITTHDSDDWSHPQKIEIQVTEIIKSKGVIGSVSSWVRITSHGSFIPWITQNRIVHTNISSLMIEREVFNIIGGWDEVRAGADTEFYFRLVKVFGSKAIIKASPKIPLALGLVTNESITQSSLYNIQSLFSGVRKKYLSAAKRWHDSIAEPYMESGSPVRPFPVPEVLDSRPCIPNGMNIYDLCEQSDILNEVWYIENNRDIQDIIVDPVKHFIEHGISEFRDPSPKTSLSYAIKKFSINTSSLESKYKLIEVLKSSIFNSLTYLDGIVEKRPSSKSVLVVGHAASNQIFGAEKSLLDVCKSLLNLGLNVIILVPKFSNTKYIDELLKLSSRVYTFPYSWFQSGKSISDITQQLFITLIEKEVIFFLHLNSTVLLDFAKMARKSKVKVVFHLRELFKYDDKLCSILELSPSEIYSQILINSDLLIANSESTKREFLNFNYEKKVNVSVVNNIVESASLSSIFPMPALSSKKIKVGIVSDNSEKKGIYDFYHIARIVEKKCKDVEFLIFGPQTPEIDILLNAKKKGKYKNITFLGYQSELLNVYSKFDILLSLSHFQESFGRTILEAMSAGRIVISYDWGASSELIVNEHTGWLVEYRNLIDVTEIIVRVANNASVLHRMGTNSVNHVNQNYSIERFDYLMQKAYKKLSCTNVRGRTGDE
ncbi:glycosyltransferase [Paraglaciecola chathamensis]|uniref:glycosyltransferase n=1 Tax=Paraglaciecola chathamensis TaxID=368405 RepID=UPI00270F8880|nr:glycosyltransferase [Paraglaciecola chathamensis]MDO6838036.1 glycosyltransferase [Paraglaciecola chathamensis]